jgi:cell division protein FtsI (penicillin-binding protein 3)
MVRRGTVTTSRGATSKRGRARRKAGSSRGRLRLAQLSLVTALVLASVRLIQVQGLQAASLSAESEKERLTRDSIPAMRGSIVDRNNRVLAVGGEARQLYANPQMLTHDQDALHAEDPQKPTADQYKQQIAGYVHRVVGNQISEQQVLDALRDNVQFRYFGPLIDPDQAAQITQRYPEIGAEYRATRDYPAGTVAANIIGAANWRADQRSVSGVLGLEYSMNSMLAGRNGEKLSETASGSNVVIPGTERQLEPAVPGTGIELTIDSDLQYTVQQKLAGYVQKAGAKDGSAVVLDAKTGEVYALANDRTFDPNNPATWTESNLADAAVTTPFEPGSVNKVITAAGAIDDGIVQPGTVIPVPGRLPVADSVIHDAWQHGMLQLTFTGVLAKSSNIGTLLTAQKLGPDRFSDLVRKFGLGQPTGVGLPGESGGFVPPRNQWSGTTFANLPIGQGLSMTLLQMTDMYQAIANNGVRVPPRVISAEVRPDGTKVASPRPPGVQVVSPQTANTVKDMLRAVVQTDPEQRGTGAAAAMQGYQVSGKTGTAQQPDPACGCYSDSLYWITFAGILPADNPRFVVGLMLDAPKGGTPESVSAAPLFHEIASYLTTRYQIALSPQAAPEQTLQILP